VLPGWPGYTPFFILLHSEHGNAVPWANAGAVAAADTFGRIDGRKGICDMNGVVLTGLFTFHTADAADLTDFAGQGAFVAVAASDHRLLCRGDKRNQVFRTGFYTHGTASALDRVNFGNAVANTDRAVLAGVHTVAQAHAAILTACHAAGDDRRSRAGRDSFVLHFIGRIVIAAKAVDQSHL
jgi:hypothetical protein